MEKLSPPDIEEGEVGMGGAGSAWEEERGAGWPGAAKQGSSHIIQLK